MGSIALKKGVRVFIYDRVSVSDSFSPQKAQVILTSDRVYIIGQPINTNVYRLSFSVTVPEYDYISPVNRAKLIAERTPITDIFFRFKDYSTLTFTVNATPLNYFYINESSIIQVSFSTSISDKTAIYKSSSAYVRDVAKTSDSISLYHSIDPPFFFILFPYKPRYRYVTLSIRDKVNTKDILSAYKIPIVKIINSIKPNDIINIHVFPIVKITDTVSIKDNVYESVTIRIIDNVNIKDILSTYKVPIVQITDSVKISHSLSTYHILNVSTYSVLFAYRPRYRYVMLSISDSTNVNDIPSVYKLPIIQIIDSIKVSDSISTYHILNASIHSVLFAYRPKHRYVTLSIVDSANIKDVINVYKVPIVSIADSADVKDSVIVKPPNKVSAADKVPVSDMLVTGNAIPGGWYASILPEVIIADSPVIRDIFILKNIAIYVKDSARIADTVTVIKANKTVFITDSADIKDIASAAKQ